MNALEVFLRMCAADRMPRLTIEVLDNVYVRLESYSGKVEPLHAEGRTLDEAIESLIQQGTARALRHGDDLRGMHQQRDRKGRFVSKAVRS